MAYFAGAGLGSTLLPGLLWGQLQAAGTTKVTATMLKDALALAGLELSKADREGMVQAVNQNLARYDGVRRLKIPDDVTLPFHFTSLVPGMTVNRTRQPMHLSPAPRIRRPADLAEAAYLPVRSLAELIRSRQVTAVELTRMYLARLHRLNPKLNCVVTFLDELALEQARRADAELAAGRYRGPLHGIPYGTKDIIAVKGFPETWGSDAYKHQVSDRDASVTEMLREAGAVLLAKLTTGEIAHSASHHLGQTMNPWNLAEGAGGSSGGPACATAAGCVGFSIGTETNISILGPSRRCGLTGLRPTFGRVSRHGVMLASWTHDRVGPLCRQAEDCALVLAAIARPDGRDLSVEDIPFNWDARLDIRRLRVGYIVDGFEQPTGQELANGRQLLEQLRALGVTPTPLSIPEFPYHMISYPIEEAVFHNELVVTGRTHELTLPQIGRGLHTARLVGAVDYLVSQRARMMMMMKFAEATSGVDVWMAPFGGNRSRMEFAAQRNLSFANLAGYPALNVPNGWAENRLPTGVTFFGRPFGEAPVLALAKAYQDAAGFHHTHPPL